MVALAQVLRWREVPRAVAVHKGLADFFAVVVHGDGVAGGAGSEKIRSRVVGLAAGLDLALNGADVVVGTADAVEAGLAGGTHVGRRHHGRKAGRGITVAAAGRGNGAETERGQAASHQQGQHAAEEIVATGRFGAGQVRRTRAVRIAAQRHGRRLAFGQRVDVARAIGARVRIQLAVFGHAVQAHGFRLRVVALKHQARARLAFERDLQVVAHARERHVLGRETVVALEQVLRALLDLDADRRLAVHCRFHRVIDVPAVAVDDDLRLLRCHVIPSAC
ncbi:hypothetical protein D3C86_1498610 [compost metagenome]